VTVLAPRPALRAASTERTGTIYGACAYAMWGLFPLFWPLLEPAGAIEILAHRIVWSLVVVVGLLAVTRNLRFLRTMPGRTRVLTLLFAAAVLIAVNWGVYIYGVNSGHVVETSLGYFINPIVTVLLGVLLLGERLRGMQWIGLGIVAVAVALLTLQYGRPPWLAFFLAVSFATYGLLKKKARTGAVESLAVETAVLAPLAAIYLGVLTARGDSTFGAEGVGHAALLVSCGVVTAVPLLFFGAAATRVPLTTLGLLQYLAPTLQFFTGVVIYDEEMPLRRLACFGLVWCGLAVFTFDAIRHHRRTQLARAVEAIC
jgi:chloramphenicol-sensitive protein RarD